MHLRPTMKNNLFEKSGEEIRIKVSEENKMCFFSLDVR